MELIRKFFVLLDERSTYQRLVLAWACWLTTEATFWCTEFARAGVYPSALEVAAVIAAVIAAVMTPIGALQAAIFAWTK